MLQLDGAGTYIQGPLFGKCVLLEEHGAKRVKIPTSLDDKEEGYELVCVIENPMFEAALWVKTERDLEAAREVVFDTRPRTWYAVPLTALGG